MSIVHVELTDIDKEAVERYKALLSKQIVEDLSEQEANEFAFVAGVLASRFAFSVVDEVVQ